MILKENRFNFVTTFHAKHNHGKEMVKSWLKNVDHKKTNAVLNVYYEGDPKELAEEVGWTDIESAKQHNGFIYIEKYYTDRHEHFKKLFKPHQDRYVFAETNSDTYDQKLMFKMDAIRFAHKIFALDNLMYHYEFSDDMNVPWNDYVGWIDADTIVHTAIPEKFFDTIVGDDIYMSYLSRTMRHSECGFLLFNVRHSLHRAYWKQMRNMYDKFLLIYEHEWHDSYLFDQVRWQYDQKYFYLIHQIDVGDVFRQSILGKYMTHFKGPQTSGK
jgi:hypothetical protein